MTKLTFLTLAETVLSKTQQALTAEEIWAAAESDGLLTLLDSAGQTPLASLGARLYTNVKRPDSKFASVGNRPKRFTLKTNSHGASSSKQAAVSQHTAVKAPKFNYLERDLHPLAVYFAKHEFGAHCVTLNHSKSKKSEFTEWLHPDLVGCYFAFSDWDKSVAGLNAVMGATPIRLFSFELKRELNFNNLRESFFQAVSNSSWANEGYLAAANISADPEFRQELERLSASFGIGIIELDTKDADNSRVVYPAQKREVLDWNAVNKLAINPDFTDFLNRVNLDLKSTEVREEKYDKVFEKDELKNLFDSEASQLNH